MYITISRKQIAVIHYDFRFFDEVFYYIQTRSHISKLFLLKTNNYESRAQIFVNNFGTNSMFRVLRKIKILCLRSVQISFTWNIIKRNLLFSFSTTVLITFNAVNISLLLFLINKSLF